VNAAAISANPSNHNCWLWIQHFIGTGYLPVRAENRMFASSRVFLWRDSFAVSEVGDVVQRHGCEGAIGHKPRLLPQRENGCAAPSGLDEMIPQTQGVALGWYVPHRWC
jgi:hypothetical protein